MYGPPSRSIIVSDGSASLKGTVRCDDGSDDSIAPPKVANEAVLKGIERFETIIPVSIQLALTSTEQPEAFTFSRLSKIPRLVLELSAGHLALNNISFLVADANILYEDLLVGYAVLKHLGIDFRALLEQNREILGGIDCSPVDHPTTNANCGTFGRLCIARLQRKKSSNTDDEKKIAVFSEVKKFNRPRGNDFLQKLDVDHFPDPALLSLEKFDKEEKERKTSFLCWRERKKVFQPRTGRS